MLRNVPKCFYTIKGVNKVLYIHFAMNLAPFFKTNHGTNNKP